MQKLITNTVIQPTIRNQGERVKEPITLGLFVSLIMTATIGAAMTPLMIALQYSARIGSMGRKFMAMPMPVAVTSVR